MFRPCININISNLEFNFFKIKELVINSQIYAVVKADAYGHGMIEIAKALDRFGINGFCVALSKELYELYESGIKKPILHLGRLDSHDNKIFSLSNAIFTIHNKDDIELINKNVKNQKINVYLKVDTGMSRMGIDVNDFTETINLILNNNQLNLIGIYSHFSSSEDLNSSLFNTQHSCFTKIIENLDFKVKEKLIFHIANSAGIFRSVKCHLDLVRPGISLYGIPRFDSMKVLKPVMEFKAPIILIKNVLKASYIGYNATYKAKKNMRIGLVQAGYADGVPTELSNNFVYYKNEKIKVLGKVSMDLICIDLTRHMTIQEFDFVTLWGGKDAISNISNVALQLNKIPYELLTSIGRRVYRKYE